jgi:hypothetical protein
VIRETQPLDQVNETIADVAAGGAIRTPTHIGVTLVRRARAIVSVGSVGRRHPLAFDHRGASTTYFVTRFGVLEARPNLEKRRLQLYLQARLQNRTENLLITNRWIPGDLA